MKEQQENKFYVYGYFDTRKPGEYIYFDDKVNLKLKFDYEPFYIGKGQDDRMFDHLEESSLKSQSYKNNKIKKIIKETGEEPDILMLQSGMTEQNALSLEKKIVALIGRSDLKKGPLANLTDAGDGGTNPSQETRDKISKANSGLKRSQEVKDKISIKTSGENNPNYGKIPTQETREKIGKANSTSMKTKLLNLYGEEIGMQKLEEMISRNDKAVLQYSLDGEFINIFKSESEAGRVLNIAPSGISACANGRLKTSGEFVWKNYDGGEINKKIMPVEFEENKNKKRVIQYDMQMNKINELESTMDVKRKMNLDSSWISKVCRGIFHTAGGFIWRYADDKINIEVSHSKTGKKRVVQYDMQMNKINEFESIQSAMRETKIKSSEISVVCSGKRKSAGGFIWQYVDAA